MHIDMFKSSTVEGRFKLKYFKALWSYRVVYFFLFLQVEAVDVVPIPKIRGCIDKVLVVLSGRLVILL